MMLSLFTESIPSIPTGSICLMYYIHKKAFIEKRNDYIKKNSTEDR